MSNLPRNFAEADVQRLFSPYGALTEVTTHKRGDGQSKGAFFVCFASSIDGQQAARALHNCLLPGTQRPLAVRPSTSRRREGRGANGGGMVSPPHEVSMGQPTFTPPMHKCRPADATAAGAVDVSAEGGAGGEAVGASEQH